MTDDHIKAVTSLTKQLIQEKKYWEKIENHTSIIMAKKGPCHCKGTAKCPIAFTEAINDYADAAIRNIDILFETLGIHDIVTEERHISFKIGE